MNTGKNKKFFSRIENIKANIAMKYPFYGYLLMHVEVRAANCIKLETNMDAISVNPKYAEKLSDEELEYLLIHSIMHISLLHPILAKGHIFELYNLAADITVNSLILESMQKSTFLFEGNPVPSTINGRKGYLYTTEEIYEQLLNMYNSISKLRQILEEEYGIGIDCHNQWNKNSMKVNDGLKKREWHQKMQEAIKQGEKSSELPVWSKCKGIINTILSSENYKSHLDWKKILHEFIQVTNNNYDYSFAPPERRYSESDILLPDYNAAFGSELNNIWFVVDVSGSMQGETIKMVYNEINGCINQIGNVKGKISFFDEEITDAVPFESAKDISNMNIHTGGSTNFDAIFKYLQEKMYRDLPTAIIIMTDGYGFIPDEKEALGIPVLWALTEDYKMTFWGKQIFISN